MQVLLDNCTALLCVSTGVSGHSREARWFEFKYYLYKLKYVQGELKVFPWTRWNFTLHVS